MRSESPHRTPPLLLLALLLGLALAAGACGETGHQRSTSEPTQGSPEILWDTWGTPHIFADDGAGLFYGFGWAQAHSHADLILRLLGTARGRAAEYWGEQYLGSDRWVWTVGIPGRAESWLAQQDPEMRSLLEDFTAGFNDYADRHRDEIADEVEIVLPVSAVDFLAHTHRAIHFTFVANLQRMEAMKRQFEQAAPPQSSVQQGSLQPAEWQAGSNAWAVGPDRSASGNALLVANPHLPWADLFTWFEAHLVSPELNAYGATLVGIPILAIGFNDHLGWTHTVNTHDGADLFELSLEDEGYRFDGAVHAFETTEVELEVRQGDGSLRREPLQVLSSTHGPVIARNGDKALSLAVVGLEAPHLLRQYWDMIQARDLGEFETAVRRMQMPMLTFMYADRDGNIMHHFGGETPIRPQGNWSTWARPVPGDSSDWDWTGIHPYEDLPTVRNPGSGWLQNANDPPWTTTFPRALNADDFPPYLAPRFMHMRAQRSAAMLTEDDSVTFEEAVAYKLSSRMALADRILDDLAAAVAEHGDEAAHRAMRLLDGWDRHADADSRGGVLFAAFFHQMGVIGQSLATPQPASGFATPWTSAEPATTPDGLADPAAAAGALSSAAQAVEERYGRLDVAWGEAYRFRRGSHDYPASGGPGDLGIFRVTAYSSNEETPSVATAGDSWIGIVEFADPVRAEVLLTYGNSTQPGSPHNGDQLALFAESKLRPAWRSRDDIEANLERREVLTPQQD